MLRTGAMSTYTFEIQGGEVPNGLVVSLGGELDLTNARELEERLGAVDPEGLLVVDLNRVVFVDSAALHLLFKLARRRPAESVVFVLDPSSPIAKTLAIVGLGEISRIAPSLAAARLGD